MTEPEPASLVPIADGVLAWVQPDGSWWINNAGVVLGDGGPLLVDTCATERRTRRFLAAVDEAAGGAAVRVAVNTHWHGDHTYGNSLLPESTVIVGHQATRDGVLADVILANTPPIWSPTPQWGALRLRPPTVVLHHQLTVFVGDRRVELRHPGHPAHTLGDVVAWLPDDRVLFTGDLIFHRVTPLVLMGSLSGALRGLDWLASFGADRVVPGHGPLIDGADFPAVLDAHARYYRFVLDTASAGRAAGLAPLDAARRADLGEFAAWPDNERLVLNLHRAYAELAGQEADILGAFTDTVAYHGGPLRCAV
ncbi:MAG TPA: MBL fold metallo-hydrolase [Actinophytocola sp.]|uniref:MBL fold metallo-hydrolase n=1 Tax=Actinophytocola sp. TaxID=1872138 RepID=UPI002DDDB5B3|nr:MBL fold metallo-hydrolase [Actinophytocola sp.]HEV2779557.1 MBL fold metallo-hydrolase [Actinophytocola sp.]